MYSNLMILLAKIITMIALIRKPAQDILLNTNQINPLIGREEEGMEIKT